MSARRNHGRSSGDSSHTIVARDAHGGPRRAGARAAQPWRAAVIGATARLLETVRTWIERQRQRRELMSLDERLLKDIGVSRVDAEAEWRKPPWRP